MLDDERAIGGRSDQDRTVRAPSRLFTVRLWTEEGDGGTEFRGSVRDVAGGAFRGFRDWSDLTAFMIAQLADDADAQWGRTEGGPTWPLEERR